MTAETLKIIVQGLNDEPFNMKLNVIHFNALSSGKLLQILSDVLRWIESAPRIKIVQESAEDTALRIFDTLRVLRYKPPVDLEQLQEWRRGIVEGEKFAVYPILEWIFNNSDKLKERIYLAKYLTKIDVPGEYHDVETAELSNQITALMEEFKESYLNSHAYNKLIEIHSRTAETRKDTILVEDIKSDLKAMEQEKEYLLKKVEKTEDKLKNIPNAPKLLEFANILRLEKQREDVLMLQIQEQRNLMTHLSMKAERLRNYFDELEKAGAETADSITILKQLQASEELETNRYIVKEKLPKEIESKRAIIAELSKIANMPAIDEKSIADIQAKIEAVNQEILAMAKKGEEDDSDTSEFSLYRYQVTAISRKKAALAEKLQKNRAELERLEKVVETKKNELRSKTGEADIISTTEFKKYANDVRLKANSYRKLREQIDSLKLEQNIVTSTSEILKAEWETDKEQIERKGGIVIEEHSKNNGRLSTSRPQTTDVNKLKTMIWKLKETLDSERESAERLKSESAKLKAKYVNIENKYKSKKSIFDDAQQQANIGNSQLIESVKQMEKRVTELRREVDAKKNELSEAKETLNSITNGHEDPVLTVENEISQVKFQINETQRSLTESVEEQNSTIDRDEQIRMWQSLQKIFELKLKILQNPGSGIRTLNTFFSINTKRYRIFSIIYCTI